MSFLMPKQVRFFDLLTELHGHLKEQSDLFCQIGGNIQKIEELYDQAELIEHRGDVKTHEIIHALNHTFITPIDREDIYTLAHKIDNIIDLMEDIIIHIRLYNITQPIPLFDRFAGIISSATDHLGEMLVFLAKGKASDEMRQTKVRIHELEDEGDLVYLQAIRELFSNNSDPITIIKLKEIYEGLEKIVDIFQKNADLIEAIIVKSQ